MSDIMGEDGLKWKDGFFLGLSDYLEKENEKDHFYQTEEEKRNNAARQGAAAAVPKFTDKLESKQDSEKDTGKDPLIF